MIGGDLTGSFRCIHQELLFRNTKASVFVDIALVL